MTEMTARQDQDNRQLSAADEVRAMACGFTSWTCRRRAAQSVQAATGGLRGSLDQFTGILNVASVVASLLVLLIAFNTASTGMDERSREHATMMAFGLPARTVPGLTIVESALLGVLGTVAGRGLRDARRAQAHDAGQRH